MKTKVIKESVYLFCYELSILGFAEHMFCGNYSVLLLWYKNYQEWYLNKCRWYWWCHKIILFVLTGHNLHLSALEKKHQTLLQLTDVFLRCYRESKIWDIVIIRAAGKLIINESRGKIFWKILSVLFKDF